MRQRAFVLCALVAFCLGTVGAHPDPVVEMRRLTSLPYPVPALQAGVGGEVILRCLVQPSGEVISVSVVSGTKALAVAAAENAKLWLFEPGASEREATLLYSFRVFPAQWDPKLGIHVT